jgi:sarcosine oxidase gamma subunit
MEIEAAGVRVRADRTLHVAALRHVEPTAFGMTLPGPLEARREPAAAAFGAAILAWRSPTETWLLSAEPQRIAALQAQCAGAARCCVVDQSGGIVALRLEGPRRADLIERLGSSAAVPKAGQALTSRLADVAVMALSIDGGEILLLVERVYREHLEAWIRETLADF